MKITFTCLFLSAFIHVSAAIDKPANLTTPCSAYASAENVDTAFLPLTGGALSGPLTGTSASFNSAGIGTWSGAPGYAWFGHPNQNTSSNFALIQSSTGATILNSVGILYLRSNGSSSLNLTSSSADFSVPVTGTGATFNSAGIGNWNSSSDYGWFGHHAQNSANNYSLIQSSAGITNLNSVGTLYLNTDGTSRFNLTSSAASFSVPVQAQAAAFSGDVQVGGSSGIILANTSNSYPGAGTVYSYITKSGGGGGSYPWNQGGTIVFQSESLSGTGGFAFSTGATPSVKMTILDDGRIGVGTSSPTEKFSVNGNIVSRKMRVTQTSWSDCVFDDGYLLTSLSSIEKYIMQNKHLPDVPTAKQVEESGIDIGETQALLLKKIEELTLHLIAQQKQVDKLNRKVRQLETMSKEVIK